MGSNVYLLPDQLIETKQRFISQVMSGKAPSRSCEDLDEAVLSYGEIKALSTGNPHILEKVQLETDVTKLRLLKSSHVSQRYRLEDMLLLQLQAKPDRKNGGYRT